MNEEVGLYSAGCLTTPTIEVHRSFMEILGMQLKNVSVNKGHDPRLDLSLEDNDAIAELKALIEGKTEDVNQS